jgi:hypothetical protein
VVPDCNQEYEQEGSRQKEQDFRHEIIGVSADSDLLRAKERNAICVFADIHETNTT